MADQRENPFAPPTTVDETAPDWHPRIATATAEITPIPPPEGGRVVNSSYFFMRLAAHGLPLAAVACLIASMAPVGEVAFLAMLTVCVGGALLDFLWINERAMRLRFRYQIASRQSRIVAPDMFDVSDVLIATPESMHGLRISPRLADIGLYILDLDRREILIEGDNARYRIPAGAILECDRKGDKVFQKMDGQFRHLKLVIATESGPRVLLLTRVRPFFELLGLAKERWANKQHNEIEAMIGEFACRFDGETPLEQRESA